MHDLSRIRNFCIIAHIDHGKSTLADRMLQLTHAVDAREFRDQMLDDMDLERERGITIKSHPVTMRYTAANGIEYHFNLIDTPGHVDFSYEVSRSLAACEGAILLVDAAQGVEAQTVANTHLAVELGLELVPVINKIDLPNADPAEVSRQVEEVLTIGMEDGLLISAKTGRGVEAVMEALVRKIPPPASSAEKGLRALIFDSVFDVFRGVVAYVRVVDGRMKMGDRIRFMGTGYDSEVKEVGIFTPKPRPVQALETGQVGYLVSTIRRPGDIRIGDTVTEARLPARVALPGFKEIQPMVFSGLYPLNTADYEKLKLSLDKLRLNDCAFSYQPETSVALGLGFRCGFLGLLHLEIVQERLRREYDVHIISTYPSVVYKVHLKDGTAAEIDNPIHMPDPTKVEHFEEPMLRAFIICPNEHIGDVMKLVMERRGAVEKTESVDTRRVIQTCVLPLNEILIDFYDNLKSVSHGYASMDYEHIGYAASDLVKLDILLNGEIVDAFSCLVHRSKAQSRGRQICRQLKETIPQHLFSLPIQAAIGRTVVARETIRALRKDVTAKCYGGDITRKRKLLERQKEGKRRMKQVGSVSVPQEAFIAVLKVN
ncbi:MAG: elongation factor 4 [Kiritimatiellae bacterium]|nr:elongation factor 4 [Kiritimatiellia bacterium]